MKLLQNMPSDSPAAQADPVEVNSRLAAIVESSDDAIIGKDLQGIITSWNQGAEQIFGYTAREAVGQSILMLIPPDRRDEEALILECLKRGERIKHYETVRRTKDGRDIEVSLTISPIKDRHGKIIGASKIAREITDRNHSRKEMELARKKYARDLEKKIEERTAKLQAALSELETFSYSVSHDLRAPLRAMQQYAQVLIEDYGGKLDDTGRCHLQRIVDSGLKLDALIRDLLAYSRFARSNMELRPMELEPLIREVIAQHPSLQPPQAEVRIETPLAPVLGNEIFLTQCLSNLLGNAAKFVPPGTQPIIRLWTELIGRNVRLWIQDNGIGIAPEHHGRVFALFERLSNDQDYEGTGIGLAIVHKAMERMGGSVGVDSKKGKGSKFWIELSHATEAAQAKGAL